MFPQWVLPLRRPDNHQLRTAMVTANWRGCEGGLHPRTPSRLVRRAAMLTPTLLCRMSMRPQRSTAVAIAAARVASRVTSACTATHSPPDSAASTAVSSAETRSRSTARIFAPSCAKRSIVARPLPIPSPGLCCERDGLIRPQCRRIIRRHNLDDLIALAGSTRRRGRPTGRLGPSRQPATGRLRQRRRIRRARCGF